MTIERKFKNINNNETKTIAEYCHWLFNYNSFFRNFLKTEQISTFLIYLMGVARGACNTPNLIKQNEFQKIL